MRVLRSPTPPARLRKKFGGGPPRLAAGSRGCPSATRGCRSPCRARTSACSCRRCFPSRTSPPPGNEWSGPGLAPCSTSGEVEGVAAPTTAARARICPPRVGPARPRVRRPLACPALSTGPRRRHAATSHLLTLGKRLCRRNRFLHNTLRRKSRTSCSPPHQEGGSGGIATQDNGGISPGAVDLPAPAAYDRGAEKADAPHGLRWRAARRKSAGEWHFHRGWFWRKIRTCVDSLGRKIRTCVDSDPCGSAIQSAGVTTTSAD